MNKAILKQSLMSSAVALAMTAAAMPASAGSLLFDPTGSGGAGISIVSFTWEQNSVLSRNTFNNNGGATDLVGELRGQGQLQSLVQTSGPAVSNQTFTYAFYIPDVTASKTGSGATNTVTWTDPASVGAGYFRIFANGGALSSAALTNGDAFNNGTLILEGTVVLDTNTNVPGTTGSTSSFQISNTTAVHMGGAQADPGVGQKRQAGTTILTIQGGGGLFLDVNVTPGTVDTNYFRSNISSLDIDLNFDENLKTPYATNVYVPNVIDDTTPFYGGLVAGTLRNDFICNGGATPCDMIFGAATGNATVLTNPVPEPGSLALLGLGLLGLGGLSRARRRAK